MHFYRTCARKLRTWDSNHTNIYLYIRVGQGHRSNCADARTRVTVTRWSSNESRNLAGTTHPFTFALDLELEVKGTDAVKEEKENGFERRRGGGGGAAASSTSS